MKSQNHSMHQAHNHSNPYMKLLIMVALSYASMYLLMYAMVDKWENVIPNINQFYMAGLMTAPMLIIEIMLMGGMYGNKKMNFGIIALGIVALAGFYLGIRTQTAVGDKEFLRSMIPHHAGAILMVEQTAVEDPDIKKLQKQIIESQQAEINFMKKKLAELEK